MIKHYKGEIGEFDFNDKIFELRRVEDKDTGYEVDRLYYIKPVSDGPIYGSKIHIPDGIKSCKEMFIGCTMLQDFPKIPYGVVNCDWMFSGCLMAKGNVVIPNSVISCNYMFNKCVSLDKYPVIPPTVMENENMFRFCMGKMPIKEKDIELEYNEDEYEEDMEEVEDLIYE